MLSVRKCIIGLQIKYTNTLLLTKFKVSVTRQAQPQHGIKNDYHISMLPRQYLAPELTHIGFNIAADLRYEILPRKHRFVKKNDNK
jgi:hypothetical protein